MTAKDRFDRYVMPEPNTGCWIWIGHINKYGYGAFGGKELGTVASRVAYQLFKGDIPKGIYVCHTCDFTGCVNPDHLFLGTAKQNTQDMIKKGRKNPCKGIKHRWTKLTDDQVNQIRLDHKNGLTRVELAEKYNSHYQTITKIVLLLRRK